MQPGGVSVEWPRKTKHGIHVGQLSFQALVWELSVWISLLADQPHHRPNPQWLQRPASRSKVRVPSPVHVPVGVMREALRGAGHRDLICTGAGVAAVVGRLHVHGVRAAGEMPCAES
ncbi:MAG: hypothetical protein DMG17_12095 [Acidobacteria bacterium]|nr:MAG: hypothetical protein DMG17_12095 [Acidobacteriota bacterium]